VYIIRGPMLLLPNLMSSSVIEPARNEASPSTSEVCTSILQQASDCFASQTISLIVIVFVIGAQIHTFSRSHQLVQQW
jgi:hypothetical protein